MLVALCLTHCLDSRFKFFSELFSNTSLRREYIPHPCKTIQKTYFSFFSIDLMQKLVSSSDLFVMQTEFSIYVLLRYWMFLHLHPEWESSSRESLLEAQQYFQNRKGKIIRVFDVIYINKYIVLYINNLFTFFLLVCVI